MNTMRAAFLEKGRGLIVGERPRPRPKANELLIKVHATCVNPSDWKWLRTMSRLGLQYKPGADFSGVVEAVGAKVTSCQVGDPVFALRGPGKGCASEYLAVPAGQVIKKPDDVSHEQAAGVPTAGITAWHGLTTYGKLTPGQKVLVVGASGGIGTFAVQMAKALGAEVVGVCSTRNVELVKSLGADHVIDYTKERVIAPASHGPFDLILDTVGNEDYKAYFSILTERGLFVSTVPSLRNLTGKLKGYVSTGGRRATFVLVPTRGLKQLKQISALMEQQKVSTYIGDTFSLDEINRAYDLSASGRSRGKIIIRVPG
ncbi:NAD(P)-dependent alcohol dehydrogenase [Micromonospora sp. WMMA1363]|uniref:NAD(P)-dependent alcohol dehydrogenase n=1 Tax=Micromonospora sp. WMMA1363 TaxID=3053985 RepID=UPI00259D0A44|nr:NAD(P)-dependent alcohol dehydrogenase [Micromonospora sp. WMMA1363]MDM4719303.1 NAD(P)-dependent alcohol dehydrogenase [Micromonospora sp. WMMA1363]